MAMELIGTMSVLMLDLPGRAAAFHGCPSGDAALSVVVECAQLACYLSCGRRLQ
jgi:hypothetical protein